MLSLIFGGFMQIRPIFNLLWILSIPVLLYSLARPSSSFAQDSSSRPGLHSRVLAAKRARSPQKKPFAQVCSRTSSISGFLLKNAYPGHISRGDPRAPGFALVCASRCPKKFPVNVYYSDGSLAARIGYYGRWNGNGKPRGYCGCGGAPSCFVSSISKKARQSGRDGKVYLSMGDGSCVSATPGIRNGGV